MLISAILISISLIVFLTVLFFGKWLNFKRISIVLLGLASLGYFFIQGILAITFFQDYTIDNPDFKLYFYLSLLGLGFVWSILIIIFNKLLSRHLTLNLVTILLMAVAIFVPVRPSDYFNNFYTINYHQFQRDISLNHTEKGDDNFIYIYQPHTTNNKTIRSKLHPILINSSSMAELNWNTLTKQQQQQTKRQLGIKALPVLIKVNETDRYHNQPYLITFNQITKNANFKAAKHYILFPYSARKNYGANTFTTNQPD